MRYEDIVGFQVSVDDAVLVQKHKPLQNLF